MPAVLMSNFDRSINILTLASGCKEGPSLRELMPFFKDEPGRWLGEYAMSTGLDARGPDIMTDLRAAFQSRFTGEVRTDKSVALDLLLNKGIVQQQGESVARYAERFMATARKLSDESDSSLCRYYIRGLLPHLAGRCCVDKDDREWQSLTALVRNSLAQDLRVQTVRQVRMLHGLGNLHGYKGRHGNRTHAPRFLQGQAHGNAAMDVEQHSP